MYHHTQQKKFRNGQREREENRKRKQKKKNESNKTLDLQTMRGYSGLGAENIAFS